MILDLIHAVYQPQTQLPRESDFYVKAIEDIEFFCLSPQMYHLLKQASRFEETPEFFRERLKQESNKTLYQNLMIKNQTWLILDKFEMEGIDVIPLKGVIFTEKYFGHLGARQTSDIDLLIRPSDLQKAIKCIKTLGFTNEEESHQFHYCFSKGLPNSPFPLAVELHWNLLRPETTDLDIAQFWNQAIPCPPYKHVKELSDYHTFYMICLHGWRHNLNSLKYLLDIIQMIHVLKDKLDFEILWKDARSHKNLKRIYKTLAIVYEQFPYLQNLLNLPTKQRSKGWWEYRAIRDNNYKTYRQYLNIFQFKYLDFDSYKHFLVALLNWFVPSPIDLFYELGKIEKGNPYFQLYMKRSRTFIQFFSNRKLHGN